MNDTKNFENLITFFIGEIGKNVESSNSLIKELIENHHENVKSIAEIKVLYDVQQVQLYELKNDLKSIDRMLTEGNGKKSILIRLEDLELNLDNFLKSEISALKLAYEKIEKSKKEQEKEEKEKEKEKRKTKNDNKMNWIRIISSGIIGIVGTILAVIIKGRFF